MNQPNVPHDYNPIGSYRRSFKVPDNWLDREIYVNFGAVRSAMYLWVNGHKVGYSEDSKTPASFNISRYVKAGNNNISVEVYRWSDGSYLEDMDFWRLSGFDRSVELVARPKQHIRDFFVKAGLDTNYQNGLLSLDVDIANVLKNPEKQHDSAISGLKAKSLQVSFSLADGNKIIATGEQSFALSASENSVSYTHLRAHYPLRRQRQMCIRDRCCAMLMVAWWNPSMLVLALERLKSRRASY